MSTKRNALLTGMLFLLLFVSACGGAATEAPTYQEPYYPEEPAAPAEEPAAPAQTYSNSDADESLFGIPGSESQTWGEPEKRQPYDTFFEDYGVNPIH